MLSKELTQAHHRDTTTLCLAEMGDLKHAHSLPMLSLARTKLQLAAWTFIQQGVSNWPVHRNVDTDK